MGLFINVSALRIKLTKIMYLETWLHFYLTNFLLQVIFSLQNDEYASKYVNAVQSNCETENCFC